MANTVLITGAHGFFGRHLAKTCADRGETVFGLGHGDWSETEWKGLGLSRSLTSDITVEALTSFGAKPDVIYHLAGGASVAASVNDPDLDFRRTVGSAQAVLEYLRRTSPETRLVYPSSAAVYGHSMSMPIHESASLQPISPYGRHKREVEELLFEHAKKHSLKIAAVRYFSIYGPGLRKQLLFDACTKIQAARNSFYGTGDETRDWLYVDDAVELLLKAGEHARADFPIVNGGTGVAVSNRDVLTELFRLFGKSELPTFMGVQKSGDPIHYQAAVSRALEWGWKPRVGWKEGLRRYVEWFRKDA